MYQEKIIDRNLLIINIEVKVNNLIIVLIIKLKKVIHIKIYNQ